MRSRAVSFSSLYIGILAATFVPDIFAQYQWTFQFPLHRDPRCNCQVVQVRLHSREVMFQFPLHRDPRCNSDKIQTPGKRKQVSVPFTSGSSLQHLILA